VLLCSPNTNGRLWRPLKTAEAVNIVIEGSLDFERLPARLADPATTYSPMP
jgi:hypothetical protein